MQLIRCDESYSNQILDIFNDAILNSTALYEYRPRTPEIMAAWFEGKRRGNYPVLGLIDDDGQLIGFGSYGAFRAHPAYKYTVEHSIYVATARRRQGAGKRLLTEVIRSAEDQNYHVLVGVIDAQNNASITLHKSLGFEHCGTVRHAGFKFGRWLDAALYQLILDTPSHPQDG